MADLPYDSANGEALVDGTKDFEAMDNSFDPASPSPFLMEARNLANFRDYCTYLRTLISSFLIEPVASILFDTTAGTPTYAEGLVYYDNVNKCLAVFNDEADVTLQVGQELWVRVYNDTGATIDNGEVCYLSGTFSTFPTVALADASDSTKCLSTLGFATHDIENASYGYITTHGIVRDIDTSACTAGDKLYLSGATPGAFTKTQPTSPNYVVNLGNASVINATTGTVFVAINSEGNTQDTQKFYNGCILEDPSFTVSSNGTVITASLEKTGGGDLSLVFDAGFTVLDCTPAKTATLTVGTDTVPVLNYCYVAESTPTAITVNTTGFPTTEQFIPLGTVLCQSASSAQADGVLKQHNWTDHFADSNGQGHLSDVNKWIRNQNATWLTGSALTPTGGVNTFDVATTSGSMLQLHEHMTDVFNTSTGSDIYVVNDNTTPYNKVGDLTTTVTDSEGVSLSGKYYSVVFWIAGNQGSGNDKLYCNLPSGSYNNSSDAVKDLNGYSNFTIPGNFKGVGILIARVTVRNQSGSGGTFTMEQTDDLRGLTPSNASGSVGGGGGAENFTDLLDVPSSYSGEGLKAVRVNTGETALEFYTPSTSTPAHNDTTSKQGGELTAITSDSKLVLLGDTITDQEDTPKTVTNNGSVGVDDAESPFADGGSYAFDGTSNQYLGLANNSDFTWNTSNCSMDMYVYMNSHKESTVGQPLQFGKGLAGGASAMWTFGTNADGFVEFYYFNGGTVFVTGTTFLALDKWHHIAMSLSGSTIRLYANGVQEASVAVSGTPSNNTDPQFIGRHNSNTFDGNIANLNYRTGTDNGWTGTTITVPEASYGEGAYYHLTAKEYADLFSGSSSVYGELRNAGASAFDTTPVKISWSDTGLSSGTTVSTTNNRITAGSTGIYKASATVNIEYSSGTAQYVSFGVFVNGTIVDSYISRFYLDSAGIKSLSLDKVLSLSANDYVEIYAVGSNASAVNVTSALGVFSVVNI